MLKLYARKQDFFKSINSIYRFTWVNLLSSCCYHVIIIIVIIKLALYFYNSCNNILVYIYISVCIREMSMCIGAIYISGFKLLNC